MDLDFTDKVALITGTIGLLIALNGYFAYDAWVTAGHAGFWQVVNCPWIPSLGAGYHLAA